MIGIGIGIPSRRRRTATPGQSPAHFLVESDGELVSFLVESSGELVPLLVLIAYEQEEGQK